MMELQALKPQLVGGLQAMRSWFHKMVNPADGRLYYKYVPSQRRHFHEASPIREVGSAADLGELQAYFGTQEFTQVINKTLGHFNEQLVRERSFEEEGALAWSYPDPNKLGEPSSIAHNSMLILALASLEHRPVEGEGQDLLAELAEAVLRQQRADGTYKVYFLPPGMDDFGWELYSGECMLALMAAYQRLGDERCMASVRRTLPHYEQLYRSGSVDTEHLVFFANWQSQAGRLLAEHTNDSSMIEHIAAYVYHMHDTIIDRLRLYEAVKKTPERMATVEVACGLEGLVAAFALALQAGAREADRQQRYSAAIATAVQFLQEVQAKPGGIGGPDAAGGFGHGLQMPTQRIDVTGHVSSAYIKLLRVLEKHEL